MGDEDKEEAERADFAKARPTTRDAKSDDPHGLSDEVGRLAEILGVSPAEAYSTITARTANIMAITYSSDELSTKDRFVARDCAQDLAIFALEHGLSDEDVADQWISHMGKAWEYALKKREQFAARFTASVRDEMRGYSTKLPMDNILRSDMGAALGQAMIPAVLRDEIQNLASSAAKPMVDAIKRLQGVNRDLARSLIPPAPNFETLKLDGVNQDLMKADRIRREREQEWRDDVVAGLTHLAELTTAGNKELMDQLRDDSSKSRTLSLASIWLLVATLLATIVSGFIVALK